ncbi:hypothetical protein DSM07_03430 [Oenococcus sp. UCMA 16435]|nr:hypothetical protein DSM07_03430 [Oenococcus sp. UCMA 16435]
MNKILDDPNHKFELEWSDFETLIEQTLKKGIVINKRALSGDNFYNHMMNLLSQHVNMQDLLAKEELDGNGEIALFEKQVYNIF